MPPVSEQARDEAYASAPADQVIAHMIELQHPTFPEPLRFITSVEERTAVLLENGGAVYCEATAFDLVPPGFEDGGPTPARLRVDGVASKLYPVLKQATAGGVIKVIYRAYLLPDVDHVVDLIEGLELKKVSLTATVAEGELSFAEIGTQAFPRRTYDLENYPALWNS